MARDSTATPDAGASVRKSRGKRDSAADQGSPRPRGRSSTGNPHPEPGVALALLKYFYWIEIGIRSYLRSQNDIELSRSEGLVIASIMLGYSRPSDIARQQGVSRQATHRTIQQMRSRGMVELVPDPSDGRIKLVALTALAHKMNSDGIVAMQHLWQELAKRVGRTNLDHLASVLRADWGPPITFGDATSEASQWP